jgi:tetratricopeptide (TPR) repeat protein
MVRQYGAEKLALAGEGQRLRQRHRDYYAPLIGVPAPDARPRFPWPEDLTAEHDNLRLALEFSFRDPSDIEAGPRIILTIDNRWPSHHEYVDWYARAVAFCDSRPDMPLELHADLLRQAAVAAITNDPQQAMIWGKRAVDLSRQLGPAGKRALMWNLYVYGHGLLQSLRDAEQAQVIIAEAESLFLQVWPDPATHARMVWFMGFRALLQAKMANLRGQYALALQQAAESIRIYESNTDNNGSVQSRVAMGEAYLGLGELGQAHAQFIAGLQFRNNVSPHEALNEKAHARRWVGVADFRLGHLDAARDNCQASLRLAMQIPDRNVIASGLGLAALIEAGQGQPLRSAALAGASAAMWQKQGHHPWDDCSLEACLPGWPARPDQAAIAAAYAAGQAMDADEAVAYALGATL